MVLTEFWSSPADMKDDAAPIYPGAGASMAELVALAEAYRRTAEGLLALERSPMRPAHAPARLCALQAIELYLGAFLRIAGHAPEDVRGHLHDLGSMAVAVADSGLKLRRRTIEHLVAMNDRREYLVVRYGPEQCHEFTASNRLEATLREVAVKVERQVAEGPGTTALMK